VIAGRAPLLKSTSMRQRITSIDQDYAELASKGGGRHYITTCEQNNYRRELGASIEDVAAPRDSISQEYIDALLVNRNTARSEHTFLHAHLAILGGAVCDVPFSCPPDTTFIMVVSITQASQSNTLYFSFDPTGIFPNGRNPAGSGIAPKGTEEWIPFHFNSVASQGKMGTVLKFSRPFDHFFIAMGFENGADCDITFLVGNDYVFSQLQQQ